MWLFKLQGETYSIIFYKYCQRKNGNVELNHID